MERGAFSSSSLDDVQSLLRKFSPFSSLYKFCPGIELSTYDEYRQIVHFDPKSLRRSDYPTNRIDSSSCLMWFQLGKFVPSGVREKEAVPCRNCSRLKSDLAHQMKRTLEESPAKKIKRCSASSRARLTYMSPRSQEKRKMDAKIKRDSEARKSKKYEDNEFPLSNEQDEEMSKVMTSIERECSTELSQLFEEGDSHGVGDKIREIWENDRRVAMSHFQRDQSTNSKLHF